MDRNEEKRRQKARHLAGNARARSYGERKQLKAERAERRADLAEKKERRRARDGDEWDDPRGGSDRDRRRRARRAVRAGGDEPPRPLDPAEVAGRDVAVVVAIDPGRCSVLGNDGRRHPAVLAESLARTQRTSVAIGDRVVLEEPSPGHLVVRGVLERSSVLSRPDPASPGIERVVAANVDRAIVVASARAPALRPRLIDRYLVALERGGIEPIVAVSKLDLVDDASERARIESVLGEFRDLGASAVGVSVASGVGLEELRRLVVGRVAVLVGQSGVGKSSLANALFGAHLGAELGTGRVRDGDGKGRHTTTRSSLFAVDDAGTSIIDTPGVRSFGLADVTRDTLASYFRDFDAARAECRFTDCSHVDEPDCGVRAAVEDGRVAARRFEAYRRIRDSLD